MFLKVVIKFHIRYDANGIIVEYVNILNCILVMEINQC